MSKLHPVIRRGLALLLMLSATQATAATFSVNSTADGGDNNAGNGSCASSLSGNPCTLRAAVEEANALGGSHTINLPGGTYVLTLNDDINISSNITFNGSGSSSTIIDGNSGARVFDIAAGSTVSMSDLTITNGDADGEDGGGIRNDGALTLLRVVISNNQAEDGGAIYSDDAGASISVTDSSFTGNDAYEDAGAIYMRDGQANFERVTFDSNSAGSSGNYDGGAIYSRDNTTTLINVTLSNNSTTDDGGGLYVQGGTVTVTNATFYRNLSGDLGDNIRRQNGTAEFRNTIADNNDGGNNCSGTLTDNGGNLYWGGSCTGWTSGNPDLLALADNGGYTQTHAITTLSPANALGSSCPSEDQRGVARAVSCDTGAFELPTGPVSGVDLALTISDDRDPVTLTAVFSYMLTVSNNGTSDATGVALTDTLPPEAIYQAATSSQGSCSHAGGPPGGTLSCALGDLTAGSSATVELVVQAPSYGIGGGLNNNASVAGNETESNNANNSATENTTLISNTARLCYVVADGGDRLIEFDTAGGQTDLGSTVATSIEAIAYHSASGVLYAADAYRFGWLNRTTGAYTNIGSFGTADGAQGSVNLNDVDGLAYDATTGVMYGVDARSGNTSGTGQDDLLFQIDISTGAFIPDAFGPGVDYIEIQQQGNTHITDDIAVDPTTGILYGTVNNGGTTDRLITINKTTGLTQDIALITVPDIEGLGTDFSGQLWGTSGTQGYLYEIDKNSGIGSNGVPILTGSDHEAVDCYAVSPSVAVDISLTKSVDDATPAEGATVSYTLSATNNGPSSATTLQISDLLPAGVTFSGATPSQGIYDSATGNWFIGTVAAGSSVTLTITATVDALTSGSTISNTAAVQFVSQGDINSGNDTASADIVPTGGTSLLVLKSSSTVRDPLGAVAPAAHAIPGAVVEYAISVSNSGGSDATSVVVTDTITASLSFLAGEYDSGNADIEITVGAAAPVYCIAETGADSNADGCFLDATGTDLTATIPIGGSYPTGLTVGTTVPNNTAVVRFRATIN